ncbi:MAG: DUF188 domain-containing protein [Atopobiaceae bacterium]|nr:DUF188 domain-containing protein [Atopobiaceae bacterium]
MLDRVPEQTSIHPRGAPVPTLFVDADACPTTREALACARKARIPCVLAGDSGHNLLRHVRKDDPTEPPSTQGAGGKGGFWVRTLQVGQGADAADFAIVCELEPGDVVVTQDFGLASMALGRGCKAIDPRGHVYDQRTIDALLLVRHATKQELRSKRRHGKPRVTKHAAFDEEDRERFVRNLTALLNEV